MIPRVRQLFLVGLFLPLLPVLFPAVANAATAPAVTELAPFTEGVSTPVRIASDPLGNFFVTDPRGGGILKFNNAGRLLRTMTAVKNPLGIAVAANGELLVSQGSAVAVLDGTTGAEKRKLGSGIGQFKLANGIALDSAGRIYVVDSLDNAVLAFDAGGSYLSRFGTAGSQPGQFLQPTGIAFEKTSGQLAVADTMNGRIQFFTTAGVHQKTVGSAGAGPLKFTAPLAVAFEYSRDDRTLYRTYVVDAYQSTIQVIDPASGAFLRYIGSYGTASGKLVVPTDVVFDRFDLLNNRLAVANGAGNITLFGIDSGSGATTPVSGPLLTLNSVPLVTNLTTLTISGTMGSATTVTVTTSTGAKAGATLYPSSTSWSTTVSGLVPGGNLLTVTATGPGGLTNVKSASVTLLAGTGAPPVPLTITPLPPVTAVPNVTLSGTVASGATMLVNGTAATVSGAAWSLPVVLSPGGNNFLITASMAGYSDTATSLNLTLDSSPPQLAVFALPGGSTTSAPVLTVAGTVADESVVAVTVSVDGAGQQVPVVNGQFSAAALLKGGSNTVTVAASDAAGNTSTPSTRTITFDPLAPAITLATPDGMVAGSGGYAVKGTAPAGSRVTVNGTPAAMTGTDWNATITLAPGRNHLVAMATDPASGKSGAVSTSIFYETGSPSLVITSPPRDLATAAGSAVLAGSVGAGATLSATVNGAAVPVTVGAGGTFSLAIPFAAPGSHSIVIGAADPFGSSSAVIRNIIFDPTPPKLAVISSSPVKVTATGGYLLAKDRNGPVGTPTVADGVATLDLSGVPYDQDTLNIAAVSASGITTRDGDINLDGRLDIGDALNALRICLDLDPPATFEQLLHGDVGPIQDHEPTTDGRIRLTDVTVILRKVIGISW